MFSHIKDLGYYKSKFKAVKDEKSCVELYEFLLEILVNKQPVMAQILVESVADAFQLAGFESTYPELDQEAERMLTGEPVNILLAELMVEAVKSFADDELILLEQDSEKEPMDDNEAHEVHVSFERIVPINEYVSVFNMKPYLL